MSGLKVNFCGIELDNPVVIASAPPTETIEGICRCAEAGAGAVVVKTLADFDAPSFRLGARRAGRSGQGFWALSTFRRETLTLDEGARLIEHARRETDMPIIASVGALDLEPEGWIAACLAAVDAGATLVQLDLFYLPQPRCSQDNAARLLDLLSHMAREIRVPVIPKLNLDLPAHFAADLLGRATVRGVSLLDSVRTPPPFDAANAGLPVTPFVMGADECSLFGGWQKPITLQYTSVLARKTGLELLAGGGLMDGKDAAQAIALGATATQFATAVIMHGYGRIGRILQELDQIVEANSLSGVAELRGVALRHVADYEAKVSFEPAIAVVDDDLCIHCGKCTNLVFCPDVVLDGQRVEIMDDCEGCGLCVSVCPKPGALLLRPINAGR